MTRYDEPAEGDVAGVAAVLAAHQRVLDGAGSCRCGKWPPVEHDIPWPDHQADALRDLLAAAWDEGFDAATRRNVIGLNRDHERNPYRATERAQ